ncbi:MAG TPA: twin transmembrane helix small protein [Rhizomicrobium sp.]|jgi:uncharacterized iron-regulated membrane protein|nr:twin transmembrane helix small protein [Rhizomicrobium sp.]
MMAGNILIGVALLVVFAILVSGIYVMMKGGQTSATWSNRLMRYRVIAQFIAILVVLLVAYVWRR